MRLAHWIAIDFIVAGFAALACLFTGLRPGDPFGEASRLPDSVVFATLVFLAVGLRRRGPLAAFGVLSAVVLLAAFSPVRIIDLMGLPALAYVLYLVTVTSTRRVGLAALSGGLLQIMAVEIAFYGSLSHGSGPAIPVALSMIIAWMTGYSVRQRRAYIEMLQVQAASSAVTQERLRIARELHDVVAHSMSVIAVQAGFGQYVIDDSPHDAREALGAIQATSRDALAELRRILGVLRQQDVSASAPLTPECGLGELERLVHTTRGGGIEVALTRSGDVRDLPTGIDVSAYRIIQEALTNVVKHAGGGARCAVSVEYGDKSVTIAVTDDGGMGLGHPHGSCTANGAGASNGAGAGHGLIGMRERVQLCGGELCAGPLPRGGFRVLAQLPIRQAARPDMPALELIR